MAYGVYRPAPRYRGNRNRPKWVPSYAAPAGPAEPTECWMDGGVYDRDLAVYLHIAIQSGMGYHVEYKLGAGLAAPAGPNLGSGWTVLDTESATVGGDLTIGYPSWPTNDDDYTLVVWEYNGSTHSATPASCTAFAMPSPNIGACGDDYVSMEITTARAGFPRIQLSRFSDFTTVSSDFNAYNDGVQAWRLAPPSSGLDLSDPTVGDPLDAGGWPAGSQGYWCRRAIARQEGVRYVRALHASGPS